MTTRTDTGPTPAKLAGLDPADYSDGCPECTGTAQRAEDYIVLPHRIRPTRTGLWRATATTADTPGPADG